MNKELLAAVTERQQLGHSKEEIFAALEAAGYDHETIELVYEEAKERHARTEIPLADQPDGHQFVPGASTTALAGPWTLFKGGWSYMMQRLDFVLFLSVLLVIATIADYVSETQMINSIALSVFVGLVVLGAVVLYMLGAFGLLYAVATSIDATTDSKITIGASLRWAAANFWSLAWISLLVLAVVVGGFVLFIIPGLIIAFYLYFSQYVYVTEGVKGLAALKRSMSLVSGHWWELFWRFIVVGLLAMIPAIIVGVLVAIGTEVAQSGEQMTELVLEVVMQIVGAALTVVIVHAAFTLLRQLAARQPHTETTYAWVLKLFAVLGVVAFVGFIVLGVIGATVAPDDADRVFEQSTDQSVDMDEGLPETDVKLQLQEL